MPTDPWSGSRYPASTAAPNVSQDIQNAVNDLADGTVPAFATAAARDTAFTNWKNAGNTAFSGMQAFTQSDGRFWRYDTASSSWLYAGGNPPPIVAVGAGAGWSQIAGRNCGVYKDSSGLCHILGGVAPNTAYNPQDGTTHTAAVVPAGYRPAASVTFIIPLGNNFVMGDLHTDGTVYISGGSLTSVPSGFNHPLDGVTYHPGYAGTVPLS